MLINILLITLGIIVLLFIESFSLSLFGLSIFIILALVLSLTWDWKRWVIVVSLFAIFLDILLHRTLGLTLLVTSISTALLYLLFTIMPRKDVLLAQIPYFVVITIFYLLVTLFAPLLNEGVWGSVTWNLVLSIGIKALISAIIIFGVNILIDRFRSEPGIRL